MPDLTPLLGLTPADLPARLPSPWHGAPVRAAAAARVVLEAAGVFKAPEGRRGLLIVEDLDAPRNARLFALAAEEPHHAPFTAPGERLPAADAVAGVTADDVFKALAARTTLVTVMGEVFTLLEFARSERAKRPEKIARGGGAGLNLTFAHWNRALLDALRSPLVANLLAAGRMNAAGRRLRPAASMEWWRGPSPVHDVKWDGMALSPRTTTKPLVERLLEGVPYMSEPRAEEPEILRLKPELLLERRDFIAVVKPSGLLSVPGTGGLPDALTLTAAMTGSSLTAVHRLDMDTSGILLYGRTEAGVKALMAAFREGRVEKRYRALLEGRLAAGSGRVDLPITTHPLDRLRQMVALGGRPSVTDWRRVGEAATGAGPRTLVDFFPRTGRTHQLRIHAAHPMGLNAPIEGDPYYSRAGLFADTTATPLKLHAAEIVFPDPESGEAVRLTAPEPFGL